MTRHQKQLAAYRQCNLKAARIVAADPVKYPGIMQEWAELVLGRAETTVDAPGTGPLFETEAA